VAAVASRVVGPATGVVNVVVAGVAAVVVCHPAVMDAPVGVVEAPPAPPVPVVEGPVPIVVAVVTHPAAVVAVGPEVVGGPPVDVRSFQHTPVAGHVMNGVGIVVPVGVAPPAVERSVPYEVVDAVLFVDSVFAQVHRVRVGVEAVSIAPGVVLVGAGMFTPVFPERCCPVGLRDGRQAKASEECDGQGRSEEGEDSIVVHCGSAQSGNVILGRVGL
jgi:hypothetical protein